MSNYLYYTKGGSFLDIKKSNTNTDYKCIEITDEEKENIIKTLKDDSKQVKVYNDVITIIDNEYFKRKTIVDFKNKELSNTDFLMFKDAQIDYQLTSENIEDLEEYRTRLRFIDDHYDNSEDKQNWKYVFVDAYTSGKNTNKYQLLKPSFLK